MFEFLSCLSSQDNISFGSVAQAGSVARTLRGALWQACGGDAVRVAALMDGVRGDDQSGSAGEGYVAALFCFRSMYNY